MNAGKPDPRPLGTLGIQIPNHPAQKVDLHKVNLTIGRAQGNDLIFEHPTVSRHHARLTLQVRGAFLEDLNSSNGTFVGSERLIPYQPKKLSPNQPFWLGHVQVTLQRPPMLKSFVPYYFAGATGILLVILFCLCAGGALAVGAVRSRRTPVVYQCGQPVMAALALAETKVIPSPVSTSGENITPAAGITATSPIPGKTEEPFQPTASGQAVTAVQPTEVLSPQPTSGEATTQAAQPTNDGQAPTAVPPTQSLPGTTISTQIEPTTSTALQPTTGGAAPTALPPTSGGPTAESPEQAATRSAAETYAAITPAPLVLAASQPVTGVAFLELPFPYDGGNTNFSGTLDQFKTASQRKGAGGRINSFFDHYLPLYPGSTKPDVPGGEEPTDHPIGDNILIFDGLLSGKDAYSGHPAYDFSTFEFRQPTTPVFAAADGFIFAVGEHKQSGALFVKIKHTVPGIGDFLTVYWHLHPDEYFQAMVGHEGESITAGTRIGTMGNTGWSTGHHLHFEVRFDRNGDGQFSNHEIIDPYGFIPSADYPSDPWFDSSKLQSLYLWRHALGTLARIPENGGGEVVQPVDTGGTFGADEGNALCAEPGSLPPGGTVYWSWAPDPAREADKAGTGDGCVVSVTDAQGNQVGRFTPPLRVGIYFKEEQLTNIDPSTLAIYWLAPGSTEWTKLKTLVDRKKGIASALTDRPGKCALIGEPIVDMVAPATQIEATGVQAIDGTFYDEVTISLHTEDPSGVTKTEYSLDGGSTWRVYQGPFTIRPGEIPAVISMDEEFFGGTPGNFLILASSIDGAGNQEDPPAHMTIAINPLKDPALALVQTPTATSTPSSTSTGTPSPTPSTTLTMIPSPSSQAACTISLTFTTGSWCRNGPGTVYGKVFSFKQGVSVIVDGRNQSSTWWWVKIPDLNSHCYVSDANVEIDNHADTSCLQVLRDPPTPTTTPTPPPSDTPTSPPPATTTVPVTQPPVTSPPDTTPPDAPTGLSPDGFVRFDCTANPLAVDLFWQAASDPSGIKGYNVETYYSSNNEFYSLDQTFSTSGNSVRARFSCGGYYRFHVQAIDGAGNSSSFSGYATFYIFSAGIP